MNRTEQLVSLKGSSRRYLPHPDSIAETVAAAKACSDAVSKLESRVEVIRLCMIPPGVLLVAGLFSTLVLPDAVLFAPFNTTSLVVVIASFLLAVTMPVLWFMAEEADCEATTKRRSFVETMGQLEAVDFSYASRYNVAWGLATHADIHAGVTLLAGASKLATVLDKFESEVPARNQSPERRTEIARDRTHIAELRTAAARLLEGHTA